MQKKPNPNHQLQLSKRKQGFIALQLEFKDDWIKEGLRNESAKIMLELKFSQQPWSIGRWVCREKLEMLRDVDGMGLLAA